MSNPFETLNALRDEWQAVQPLSSENEARLWKKLRLEWNYHSNHIEGNTLTYGETELLLLHDRTTGNHTHREYLEMKAHDVGIEHVRTLAADKARLITEGDIRDLNKIILKEPFWKAAETADGHPTRKEILPGQYKTTPNNVRLPNGDVFLFASVEDTAPRMSALAAWVRQELESPALHPVAFAAKLHHDFVLIHPFDDGNGRVARLLVNYVLMRSGYLPLIVRTDDKSNYLTALQLADAGELSALIGYFHQLTEWSLKLGIKAARGETIDEPSDVEKEVQIFVRNQHGSKQSEPIVTQEMVREVMVSSVVPFVRQLERKLNTLTPLFRSVEWNVIEGNGIPIAGLRSFPCSSTTNAGPGDKIILSAVFDGYQGANTSPFGASLVIELNFRPHAYRVTSNSRTIIEKDYSSTILAEEADQVTSGLLAEVFAGIKEAAERHRDA